MTYVNLVWIMIFHLQKVEHFSFYTVHMDPLVKNSDFWVIYTSQNVFYFSSKKLDVVTITRYQITFWIFDFSLFDILPKYMNPKIVSRSLYALHDLPKNPHANGRTSIFKRLPHKSPSGNTCLMLPGRQCAFGLQRWVLTAK